MNRSLSKRSVDGSRTDTVLSIHLSPDGIEGQRSSTSKYIVSPLSFIFRQIRKIWFPFVAHAIASPVWCILGCVTLNVKLLTAAASLIPHLIMCLIWTISLPLTLCSPMIKRKLQPLSVLYIFAISFTSVLLDPLFFYIPTIDEKNKCLDRDSELMIVVLVLRSLSDLVFIFQIATRAREVFDEIFEMGDLDGSYPFPNLIDQIRAQFQLEDVILTDSLLNLLVILPVQQVAIIICFFRLGSSGYSGTTTIVNIFLVLHPILRAYHIYYFHKQLKIVRKWANAALNFVLYIIAAHEKLRMFSKLGKVLCYDTSKIYGVSTFRECLFIILLLSVLGAFWYFFSIQRETSCWHRVCKDTAGCITTYYCKDSTTTSSPSVTFLNESCPISSHVNFGIYLDAFQYGTTGSINFPKKFMYAFWWGLRNLNNFGTNLETSSYLWENIFTILIAVIGLLLFLYLIGNTQTYILSASQKEMEDAEKKIRETHEAIKSWMSKHMSSCDEYLHMCIIRDIREGKIVERKYERNMNMDVDVQFFFSFFSNYEATEVKKHICEHPLKKVLWRMSSQFQSEVIEALKPKVYRKNRRVVRSKKPIDTILFIVDGVIVANNEGIGKSRYEKGDIFGDGMFSLLDQSTALISNRDYRCETQVEAFALTCKKWSSMVSNIHKYQSEETVVVYSKFDLILLNEAYRKLTTTRWGNIEREIGLKMKLKRDVIKGRELENTKFFIKEIDILDWLSRNGFSDDAKTNITKHIKGIVEQTIEDDVDIKYLLSHLPQDIQMTIRKQLGMKSLTKVPMLQNMDDSLLSIMCEKYLQPEIYSKENHLVRAGEAVGLMFIIIDGTVKAGSSRLLKRGDFYGEPLLSWASPNNLFSGRVPISSEDVICLTKVEVLELKANQFRSLVADFSSQWISNFNMCGDHSQQLDEDLAFPCDKMNKKLNELNEELAFPFDKFDKKLNETYKQLESKEVSQIEDEELRQKIKIMLKENEILDWVSSLGISKDIKTQITRSIKISKVVEENIDADVNMKYVLSILPSNIKQSLKEHICISSLKKVPILENVDEDVLNRICLNLEPVLLPQDSYVIKAGEKLNWMIIVVKGEVKCTATSNVSTPPTEYYLEKRNLFGEEILASAFPYIFSLPNSNQDMVCQTKVEALALNVDGLQSVLSYYKCKVYPDDKQCEELTSTTPLGLQRGRVVADTNLSSSTTIEQRLDQLLKLQVSQGRRLEEMASLSSSTTIEQRLDQFLRLQVSQGRRLEEMAAKLGFGATPPPAI